MHRLLPMTLLPVIVGVGACAGGCTGAETSELTFPAGQLTEFILRINHGAVVVRNPVKGEKPDACVVRVTESGGAETLGAKERFNASVTGARIRLRQRRNEKHLRLDLVVIVPKGVNVDVVVNEGGIRLEGTFGLTRATCKNGDVIADPLQTAGGALKTLNGDVRIVLTGPKIEADLKCETVTGDVSLSIPLAFRGPINLRSGSARIDYGDKPKMLLKLSADRRSARGFAGNRMSEAELDAANESGRWPPGIWGNAGKGRVVFRQEESPGKSDGNKTSGR